MRSYAGALLFFRGMLCSHLKGCDDHVAKNPNAQAKCKELFLLCGS